MRTMQDMLEEDDRGLSGAQTPTAIIHSLALMDVRTNRQRWLKLLDEYINSPRSGIGKNKDALNSAKNNAQTQLASPTLSWKKFRMALKVLNPKSVDFTITNIKWRKDVDIPIKVKEVSVNSRVGVCDLNELFSLLYANSRVRPSGFTTLMKSYVKYVCRDSKNPADLSTKRSNLLKDIKRESYTWKTFTELLAIMGVTEFTLVTTLVWWSDKKSTYTVTVPI